MTDAIQGAGNVTGKAADVRALGDAGGEGDFAMLLPVAKRWGGGSAKR